VDERGAGAVRVGEAMEEVAVGRLRRAQGDEIAVGLFHQRFGLAAPKYVIE